MQPTLAPAPHPSMQTSAQDHADQVLHDQLLAAHQHLSHPQQARPQPQAQPPPHMQQPNAASPRDQNNIDPAISGATMLAGPPQTPPQPESVGGPESPKTYGKRPLSTSKRAAQNRAAQRAFRQRKESYIRKLEEQVKGFDGMADQVKGLQNENYQLREYIINLQSRLLESQGEVPDLPANIDLSQSRADMPMPPAGNAHGGAPGAPPPAPNAQQNPPPNQTGGPNDAMNSLNRIAVAGLGMRKHPNEEANFMGHNFPGARRTRNDENQTDPDVSKTEPPSGLPVVS